MRLAMPLIFFFALSACSLGVDPVETPGDTTALNILFVGNSLTTSNDLPGMVQALIDSAGVGPVEVGTIAFPNFGLEDHWVTGSASQAIAAGGWTFVVMQQGPSATEGRPSLLDYGARFADAASTVGTTPAFYMVWPSTERFHDFDGVSESYRLAAENTGALLLPAGEAWRIAWESDPNLPLYAADGFHPSAMGTYVAALVIFEQLTGTSPIGLPSALRTSSGVRVSLNAETSAILQTAASEANLRFAPQRQRLW